jgi:pimeloyl-ACP methyl ester carboxylesterase
VVAHSFGTLASLVAIRAGLSVGRVVAVAPAVLLDSVVGGFARVFQLSPRVHARLITRVLRFAGPGFWGDLSQPYPSLIVHDLDDRDIAIANADALACVWPDARRITTTGLGHNRVLRDPDVIGEAVRFIAS